MPNNDILVFDTKRLNQQRERAQSKLTDHGFLIDWSRDQLLSRLDIIRREFETVLQLGNRTALDKTKIKGLQTLDISDTILPIHHNEDFILCDQEWLPFDKDRYDLIISPLHLHTINDLPGALTQLKNALKADGLFLSAILGGETLYELRDVMSRAEIEVTGGMSPRVAPFADMPQMGSLMQRAGFNLPVVDSEIVTVTYDHLFKLMHDLRYMGEGNALIERSKSFNNRKLMMRSAELYQELYAEEDGRLKATFEIIFLIGWKPHESQQKPLRPGSAKNRLADALNTTEISADDKASH
ncbi:MAG: methyltransferase domain-containing protein [Alphaproteobacteria bacterium]|nr:methyltransferase domain-containing protein [Alphaproteobacteria bacterium]NCQ87631.1 methyltransferase domain-containing protein [Alphaproteobacteria bacterium]NCT05860.1 methyltransferase domain-containing protein [Alphaproteobacteria bacterium]